MRVTGSPAAMTEQPRRVTAAGSPTTMPQETDEQLMARVAAEFKRSLKIGALVAALAAALGLWWR